MNIFFNGWFSGFIDKTNPGLHVDFFLKLFKKVYNVECIISDYENSDILCEFDMLIGCSSFVKKKQWKHTYLFSGESSLKCNKQDYTCVLWGERNHKNVVNIPLFIPYIYTNDFLNRLETKTEITIIPTNDICVIISNPIGKERISFLNKLEKKFKVCYAGRYKNNIGGSLNPQYNSKEFHSFVNQFKFIISMENSREDTYITEKLINGLLSNNEKTAFKELLRYFIFIGSGKGVSLSPANCILQVKEVYNCNTWIFQDFSLGYDVEKRMDTYLDDTLKSTLFHIRSKGTPSQYAIGKDKSLYAKLEPWIYHPIKYPRTKLECALHLRLKL